MRERLDDFGESTEIVLVTFTDATGLQRYRDRHELPFTFLVDHDRVAYRAFGLGRGAVARVWGFRAAKRYVELLRRDGWKGLRRPTEDTLQLGGDFVIGPDGVLTYGFWGEGPDDRPTVDELIAAARAAA